NLADFAAGADAWLLPIVKLPSEAKRLKKITQVAPGNLWGGWLKDSGQSGIKRNVQAGCDYVVYTAADTSLKVLENDELGKVLAVEASLDEGLLRAIAGLPADAVMVYGEPLKGSMLTWRHLMLFKRFASLVAQPLLVPVPAAVSAKDLQTVWEAGVMGVVVEVTDKQPLNRLKELRRLIDKLTPPSSSKRGEMQAVVPGVTAEAGPASFEEDEEEE
ncbi:MAG: hypothetical protein V3T68_04420, partial [Dehalococcoidales bacterium]